MDHDEYLYMGNSTSSKIERIGKMILKFTSGKEMPLNNIIYVSNISKNLISSSILSKKGFKMTFESNKCVPTKGGLYVGKSHIVDGLFKPNVAVVGNKFKFLYPKIIMNNNNPFA